MRRKIIHTTARQRRHLAQKTRPNKINFVDLFYRGGIRL